MQPRFKLRKQLSSLSMVASLLIASWVVVTHHHAEGSVNGSFTAEESTGTSGCSCLVHPSSLPQPIDSQPIDSQPNDSSDSDHCSICELLVEFSGELVLTVELTFDSCVFLIDCDDAAKLTCAPQYRFRGRAPPQG